MPQELDPLTLTIEVLASPNAPPDMLKPSVSFEDGSMVRAIQAAPGSTTAIALKLNNPNAYPVKFVTIRYGVPAEELVQVKDMTSPGETSIAPGASEVPLNVELMPTAPQAKVMTGKLSLIVDKAVA